MVGCAVARRGLTCRPPDASPVRFYPPIGGPTAFASMYMLGSAAPVPGNRIEREEGME